MVWKLVVETRPDTRQNQSRAVGQEQKCKFFGLNIEKRKKGADGQMDGRADGHSDL